MRDETIAPNADHTVLIAEDQLQKFQNGVLKI